MSTRGTNTNDRKGLHWLQEHELETRGNRTHPSNTYQQKRVKTMSLGRSKIIGQ